jgi:hypothetical protein
MSFLSESKINTGEVVGVDAAGLYGWFFVGGPEGATACSTRYKRRFCLGPQVWIEE